VQILPHGLTVGVSASGFEKDGIREFQGH